MAKLVNIFADDWVKIEAMKMVHQSENERARTERRIRAYLLLGLAAEDLFDRQERLKLRLSK